MSWKQSPLSALKARVLSARSLSHIDLHSILLNFKLDAAVIELKSRFGPWGALTYAKHQRTFAMNRPAPFCNSICDYELDHVCGFSIAICWISFYSSISCVHRKAPSTEWSLVAQWFYFRCPIYMRIMECRIEADLKWLWENFVWDLHLTMELKGVMVFWRAEVEFGI